MKEELIRMKNVLVIVDMVKGFKEFGNMAITDATHIDPEILRLTKLFLENDDDVISIQEGHTKESQEFNDFPSHCVLGTPEANLVDFLKPYEKKMKIIRKNSTSGYVTKEFQQYLEKNKNLIKKMIFVGVCADICVINIAIPTKMYFNENNIDCEIIVPQNATETFDAPNHSREEYKVLTKKMLLLNGIKVPEKYEG